MKWIYWLQVIAPSGAYCSLRFESLKACAQAQRSFDGMAIGFLILKVPENVMSQIENPSLNKTYLEELLQL
jgi:hypothetical protein